MPDAEESKIDSLGRMPGGKDPDAERATRKEREVVLRGTHTDEGNPSPPGEVGTGYIGLGPAEPEEEENPAVARKGERS